MAKPIQSEPAFGLDRRQLLTSAAAIAAAGIVPSYEQVEATSPAGAVSSAEIPTWNVCAATARRIAEIVKRNRIREETGLPLLSIAKELRRMKKAEDQVEFEAFATVHRRAVCDKVLSPERGQPDWRPSSFMEGVALQSQVNRVLREQFKVGRATKAKMAHSVISLSLHD